MATPVVITNDILVLGYDKVQVSGAITSNGTDIIRAGFCWNTTGNPTVADTVSELASGTVVSFAQMLSQLDLDYATYYIRAYAENEDGIGYGNQRTFTINTQAAVGYVFRTRFYDVNENQFNVQIYRPNSEDELYTVERNSGTLPLVITHGGGGKNSLETTVIQGQELTVSMFFPREDVDLLEVLFDSKYKDYVLEYTDGSSNLIFRGYIKPENLVKRYETKPPFVELELTASDGLSDLQHFEFKTNQDTLIYGQLTILEVLKKALTPIAFPGFLNFDFKVQLNTYESQLMTSTECPLLKCTVDARAFINGEAEENKAISCYDVITRVLKSFNVLFKQEDGFYYITNPSEKSSYEFLFNWDTLTQTSRTSLNNVIDISSYKFIPYIEQQRVHPFRYVYANHRTAVIADQLLSQNWGDWTFEEWDSAEPSTVVFQESYVVQKDYAYREITDPEPSPTFYLAEDVFVQKKSEQDYIIFKFAYKLLQYFFYSGAPNRVPGVPFWKIEVKGPDGNWRTPVYDKIVLGDITNSYNETEDLAKSVLSVSGYSGGFSESFRVTESGYYNIRVSLHLQAQTAWVIYKFALVNPNAKIFSETDRAVEDFIQISRPPSGNVTTTTSSSGRRSIGLTAVQPQTNSGRTPAESYNSLRRGDVIEDKIFILKWESGDGYETFESDIYFADGSSANVSETGKLSIGGEVTRTWNSFMGNENKLLVHIYALHIINHRYKYKNFLRCAVSDRNHTIKFRNIVKIEGKDYVIIQYSRDYRNGTVDLELIELMSSKLSIDKFGRVSAPTTITKSEEIPPLVTEGEWQVDHNFEVGDIVRYSFEDKLYVHAQANTVNNAHAVGLVSEVVDDFRFRFISDDYIRYDTELYKTLKTRYDLQEGSYYFLDPRNPGGIVDGIALKAGDIEQCVGYVTTKGFKVEIDARMIELPKHKAIGAIYYMHQNLSELNEGYLLALQKTPDEEEDTLIVTVGTGKHLIGEFITEVGNPDVSVIPSGSWWFETWISMSAISLTNDVLSITVFKYANGVETSLFEVMVDLTDTDVTKYDIVSEQDDFTLGFDDRLIFRYYYHNYTLTTKTCTLHLEGLTNYTRVRTAVERLEDVETDMSVTGTGTESDPIVLVNDEDVPAANYYYGTNSLAEKGYHALPEIPTIEVDWFIDSDGNLWYKDADESEYSQLSVEVVTDMSVMGTGTESDPITLVNDEETPEGNYYYGTDGNAEKGYHPLPELPDIEWDVDSNGIFYWRYRWDSDWTEFVTDEKDWIEFEFRDIEAGNAADYVLDIKALVGYTIDSAVLQVDTGTLTVAVKIGSTAVTGLSAVAASDTITETSATAANTVVEGNLVILAVSATYTGAPTLIRGKLNLTRT
jgi:hypothetical protein